MPRRILTEDSAIEGFSSLMFDMRTQFEPIWYRTKYPQFDWRNLIATDTSANAWADTVARFKIDYSGETEFMDADSTDYPLIEVAEDAGQIYVHEVKAGYTLSRAELIRASQIGLNLPTEKLGGLNLTFERDTCRRALFGSKKIKRPGIFNWKTSKSSETIPVTVAKNSLGKVIDDAAALTNPSYGPIVAYFNAMKQLVEFKQTNTVFVPTYFALPALAHNKLSATVFPGMTGSALEAVEKNLKMKLIPHYLLDHGVFNHKDIDPLTKDRIMVGSRSKEVARFHIPMPKRLETPYTQDGGLNWYQPALQRIGLTDVRIPKAFHYVDMPDYDYAAGSGL